MSDGPDGPLMLAYDGSSFADLAVQRAGALFPGRSAIVVVAWESAESIAPAAAIGIPAGVVGEAARRLDEAAAEDAAQLAEKGADLARAAGLDAQPRAVRADPNVWATICETAKEVGAIAVVVGSRGRSGVRSALLGSVSNAVVQNSVVPTVVVR